MTGAIYELMPKVAAAIGTVGKDKKASMGAGGSFSFRGIDDFLNACHTALVDHVVTLTPHVVEHRLIERERVKDGRTVGMTIHVIVTVDYTFTAPDASSCTVRTVGEAADTGDKATSKAMSQALKYALMHTFTVPTQDMAQADKAKSPDMGNRAPANGKPAPAGYDRTTRNKRLMALYNELGLTRSARLEHASEHVGRALTSATELTDDEMETLITAVAAEVDAYIMRSRPAPELAG